MSDSSERVVLDLGDVTLVDDDVVRFLGLCEQAGIRLVVPAFMCANGFDASVLKGKHGYGADW